MIGQNTRDGHPGRAKWNTGRDRGPLLLPIKYLRALSSPSIPFVRTHFRRAHDWPSSATVSCLLIKTHVGATSGGDRGFAAPTMGLEVGATREKHHPDRR